MRFTKKIPRGGEKFQAGEDLREGHAGRQVGSEFYGYVFSKTNTTKIVGPMGIPFNEIVT